MSVVIKPPTKVEVRSVNGKGRGVFATAPIHAEETIELCPVRPFDAKEKKALDDNGNTIPQFYFIWDEENPDACGAVVFGFGSIYNHSRKPNIDCEKDFESKIMKFYALRDISPGEELVFDYDVDELWFDPV